MAIMQAKPWWKSKRLWLGVAHIIGGIVSIPAVVGVLPYGVIVGGITQVVVATISKGPITATTAKAEEINQLAGVSR